MRFATVMFCGLLAACAAPTPPPPPASEAEGREATRVYMDCLVNAARRVDDRVSDARTVAAAIRPICEGDYQSAMLVQTRHLAPDSRARIMPELMSDYVNRSVGAVLIARRRASPQPAAQPQR